MGSGCHKVLAIAGPFTGINHDTVLRLAHGVVMHAARADPQFPRACIAT